MGLFGHCLVFTELLDCPERLLAVGTLVIAIHDERDGSVRWALRVVPVTDRLGELRNSRLAHTDRSTRRWRIKNGPDRAKRL